jgi:hypothetical protein
VLSRRKVRAEYLGSEHGKHREGALYGSAHKSVRMPHELTADGGDFERAKQEPPRVIHR